MTHKIRLHHRSLPREGGKVGIKTHNLNKRLRSGVSYVNGRY